MSLPDPEPIIFAERVAAAFVSAFAAALTLGAYFAVSIGLAARTSSGSLFALVSSFFFSKVSAYIVGTAGAVGFFLGSERMALVFSVLWGTHEVWEREWSEKQRLFGAAVLVAVVSAVLIHVVHSNYA